MAIYSELVYNQGTSHCHLYFGRASKAGRWVRSGKKEALAMPPRGYWHGEVEGVLTGSKKSCVIGLWYIFSFPWLVLSQKQRQKLGKPSINQVCLLGANCYRSYCLAPVLLLETLL